MIRHFLNKRGAHAHEYQNVIDEYEKEKQKLNTEGVNLFVFLIGIPVFSFLICIAYMIASFMK